MKMACRRRGWMGAWVSKISSRVGFDSTTMRLRGSGRSGEGARMSKRMLVSVRDDRRPATTRKLRRDLTRLAADWLMLRFARQKLRVHDVRSENRDRSATGVGIL